jgi:hypothetical protein
MKSSGKSPSPPFAAEGGIRAEPIAAQDPYETLDDLMSVVESLCPVWPVRKTFESTAVMLL